MENIKKMQVRFLLDARKKQKRPTPHLESVSLL